MLVHRPSGDPASETCLFTFRFHTYHIYNAGRWMIYFERGYQRMIPNDVKYLASLQLPRVGRLKIEDILHLRPQTRSFSTAMAEYNTIGRDTGVIRSVPLYCTCFCCDGVPLSSSAMTTHRESFHYVLTISTYCCRVAPPL